MIETARMVELEDFNGWVCRPVHTSQFLHITGRSPLRLTGCSRSGHPNYSQNHSPLLSIPTDTMSSCVRGAATRCKLGRSLLATAGVRRQPPFRPYEIDKARHDARSNLPTLSRILRLSC